MVVESWPSWAARVFLGGEYRRCDKEECEDSENTLRGLNSVRDDKKKRTIGTTEVVS
jgi:hypothetical protein